MKSIWIAAVGLFLLGGIAAAHQPYWRDHRGEGPAIYVMSEQEALVPSKGGKVSFVVTCNDNDFAISSGGYWTWPDGTPELWTAVRTYVATPIMDGDRISGYDFGAFNPNTGSDFNFVGFVTCAH